MTTMTMKTTRMMMMMMMRKTTTTMMMMMIGMRCAANTPTAVVQAAKCRLTGQITPAAAFWRSTGAVRTMCALHSALTVRGVAVASTPTAAAPTVRDRCGERAERAAAARPRSLAAVR